MCFIEPKNLSWRFLFLLQKFHISAYMMLFVDREFVCGNVCIEGIKLIFVLMYNTCSCIFGAENTHL
jgi:hypothetical protein